jgi:anoctamin-10
MFLVLVPRLLSFYQAHAVKFTEWENHAHQSSYDRSLTLKSFALSAIVAYGGLALSAFVYVPFGTRIMRVVQSYLSGAISDSTSEAKSVLGLFKVDRSGVQGEALIQSLKGMRLRDQVFAYIVTDQAINFVQENIVPWVVETFESARARGKLSWRRHVEPEDEPGATKMNKEDRELLDAARAEAALPDYHIFGARG